MRMIYKEPKEVIVVDADNFPDSVKPLTRGSIFKVESVEIRGKDKFLILEGSHRDIYGNPVMYRASRFMLLDELRKYILKNKNKRK